MTKQRQTKMGVALALMILLPMLLPLAIYAVFAPAASGAVSGWRLAVLTHFRWGLLGLAAIWVLAAVYLVVSILKHDK